MGELYSNFGRTNVWYALSLTVLGQCLRLRFTNPRTLEALNVMVFIWLLYFILSVNTVDVSQFPVFDCSSCIHVLT